MSADPIVCTTVIVSNLAHVVPDPEGDSYVDIDYFQCIPGTGPVTSSPPVTTTSWVTSTTRAPTSTTTVVVPPPSTASGVVTTSGTEFRLNGKKFYFVGCQ